jgi:hypothetical protein
LKKIDYLDNGIKVLFFSEQISNQTIVEGKATKENFLAELRHFEEMMDSNDSLLIFRSGHGMVEVILETGGKLSNSNDSHKIENIKSVGTEAVMCFPDGKLNYIELEKN